MKISPFFRPCFIAVVFSGILYAAAPAAAVDLFVEETPSDSSYYSAIQPAIDYAYMQLASNPTTTVSYRVVVLPGTYTGDIILKNNIPVVGRETRRTIVNGGISGTAMAASGVSGVAVRNLTFKNATTGISVSGNSTVDIMNNVFNLGTTGSAVIVQGSASTSVINNTFLQNNVAVSRDADGVRVINNIFSNNTADITSTILSESNINNNFFQPAPAGADLKGTPYFPNADFPDADPLFVDSAAPDVHLKASSPCIDKNNAINDPYSISTNSNSIFSDLGAYGGPNADTIPAQVTNITSAATTTPPYAITLNWAAATNYLVGGYRVHYGLSSAYTGTDASNGPSPVDAAAASTLTLSNLTSAASSTPAAPVLNTPQPRNGALVVSWSPVTGATSYTVYWGASDVSENSKIVNSGTSTTISPLTNGQSYLIAVTATAQTIYYLNVTAYDKSGQAGSAGVSHESAFADPAVKVAVGPEYTSALSNVLTGIPELLESYPALPNTGCFIATAAYGSADAAPVRILRAFRDAYLLKTPSGRTFVHWYYAVSPRIAAIMNDHPALKPMVRAALAPFVMLAAAANTSPLLFAALIISSCSAVLFVFGSRRKHGGPAR